MKPTSHNLPEIQFLAPTAGWLAANMSEHDRKLMLKDCARNGWTQQEYLMITIAGLFGVRGVKERVLARSRELAKRSLGEGGGEK